VGKDILRLDPAKADYVPAAARPTPLVDRILKKPAAERLKLLRESSNPQAQFLWAILRDAFHYAAVHLGHRRQRARHRLRDALGLRHEAGPLRAVAGSRLAAGGGWVKEDIDAGKALCKAPLPAWVFDGRTGVHTPRARGAPRARPMHRAASCRSTAASTSRVRDQRRFGRPLKAGTEVFKNDEMRVWTLDGEVLIASITCKLHLIGTGVTEGLHKAVELAEAGYKGLVIWSPDDVFSAGANLERLMPVFMKSGAKGIAPVVKQLQDAMLRMRYAQVPVVAAMRGMALGGGCEIAVYCARRVAAMETYVGLVEVGVGLIPAAAAWPTSRAARAEMAAARGQWANADIMKFATDGFTNAAMAKVGTSALESRASSATCWTATSSCPTRTNCCSWP
jgi:3-hydroxyacyl-CoA dehydrogenase